MRRFHKRRPWQGKSPSRNQSTDKYYVSFLWRKQRNAKLMEEPACRVCMMYDGIPKEATVLDHFRPRRLWPGLEDSPENHVPMCGHHHAVKSGMEKHAHTKEQWTIKVLPKFKKCDNDRTRLPERSGEVYF